MTIDDIAKKLNNCANGMCFNCDKDKDRMARGISLCQASLIQDMADECRKIAEDLKDDGK